MPCRGTVGDSLKAGIEAAENALNVFSATPHRYVIEQAASRFMLGWLLCMSAVLEEDVCIFISALSLLIIVCDASPLPPHIKNNF